MTHSPPGMISDIPDPPDRFLAFCRERHAVYLRRQAGTPIVRDPVEVMWTTDPILQAYRFCNVYRELDTVTGWIRDKWREPHASDPDLWFAMVVARFVNWPETLGELGYPVPWDPRRFVDVCRDRKSRRLKIWTGAYMVRAESGRPGGDKASYQAEQVFSPLWKRRKQLRPQPGDTLCAYHLLLGANHGFGSFMAAQVVADLKYVEPLRSATDWWAFAASGPGSRRGLNRVLGQPVNSAWREDGWRLELGRLQGWFDPRWGHERLHAADLQNCLCEYMKYEKTRLGEGRPRARYRAT